MHYQFRLKCMVCHLHYIVCSWKEDWLEKNKSTCPECGQEGSSLPLRLAKMDQEIYEVVPGSDGEFPFPIEE